MNFTNTFSFAALATSNLLDVLSTRGALGAYAVVLLILVAILAVHILNVVRLLDEKEISSAKGGEDANSGERFNMLTHIDEEFASYEQPIEKDITLKEFCMSFRDFAAGNLGLYYDIADIRRFIAGMSVTKLILLQGMSGTGKTSLAYAMGQFIENESVVVPIQPMWKERSDMIGYFNEFTKKFNETTLLRKMYEAGYRKEIYITILDEVNISRIEYYFAEFLSLLELPDENGRYLDVVSDIWPQDPKKLKEGRIQLPPNMWFVGTANNDDSTFAISDKVYDRAMVINLDKKCSPFTVTRKVGTSISYSQWCRLIQSARETYSLSSETEAKIRRFDEFVIAKFGISFGNRIMKQIKDYVPVMIACGGTELGATDDILSKKVLRKLEQQSPTYIRNAADELIAVIEDIFDSEMTQCIEYVNHLKKIM